MRGALSRLGVPRVRGLRVLDVGCGERAAVALLFAQDGACVHGMDLEPVALGLSRPQMWVRLLAARRFRAALRCVVHDVVHVIPYWVELRRLSARPLPFHGVHLRQADAAQLPYPDGTFDLVVSSAVWEHISDVAAATREVNRVLKPSGIAVISIALFPSLQGGHHAEWHSVAPAHREIRPWDHLYPDHRPFPLYLNGWPEADYRTVFARELDVLLWQDGVLDGAEYLTPRVRGELQAYSDRDLLLGSVTVWARKRQAT